MEIAETVRIFPCPHTEIKLRLTEQMINDFIKCYDSEGNGDCGHCSWKNLKMDGVGICTVKEIHNKLEEKYAIGK